MSAALRIESVLDRIQMVANFFSVRDYDRADEDSTDRIVKKQSRGSIFAQNGWYITVRALKKRSREADVHMRSLRRALSRAK